MELVSIPSIIVMCYVLAQILNVLFNKQTKINKLIPYITSIVGGILGYILFKIDKCSIGNPSNYIYAIVIGMVSGLTATGAMGALKKILKKTEDDKHEK